MVTRSEFHCLKATRYKCPGCVHALKDPKRNSFHSGKADGLPVVP